MAPDDGPPGPPGGSPPGPSGGSGSPSQPQPPRCQDPPGFSFMPPGGSVLDQSIVTMNWPVLQMLTKQQIVNIQLHIQANQNQVS